jgi:transcriptional regulator
MIVFEEDDYIEHYGTPRRSGRYPWGSGGNSQHSKDFLAYVTDLRRQGLSEVEIAKGLGITTTELRAQKSLAKNEAKAADIAMAQRLKDKAWSNVAIGERMGIPESSVRVLLKPGTKDKNDILVTTANMLKEQVDEKKYIDVSAGVEHHIGVSRNKLNNAVAMLKEQGYTIHYVKVDQLGTGLQTSIKVLAPPNTPYAEVFRNRDNIQQSFVYSPDGGRSFNKPQPPLSISSKRIAIKYAEEGGTEADGVVYVRPGVKDCSLGGARYSQVRIAVDGTHYIKGMAVYKDDLPDGVDLMFNTNKSNTGNKLDALKKMSDDPENPFGSSISRQILEHTKDGKTKVMSVMNLVNDEGDWDTWSNTLSTQMLSKQNPSLIKRQLDLTYEGRKTELEKIKSLTNPAVKKKLLEEFADNTDSAAVNLKAVALPRQATHVIMPVPKLKETEVYAPNFDNGERVVLIRHPHGGIFEIPELTVNNKHPEARKLLGHAQDAIGINAKVAEKLSGADFDGDTVLVIPNNSGRIKTAPMLEGLKNFDPKAAYPKYPGMKVMSEHYKQVQMGEVSNLINDMTIRGASPEELARAVRHSMVVIDATKHELNYKQSAIDNGIRELKARYQSGGASTLISRAKSEQWVVKRKPRPMSKGGPIDPKTGEKVYEDVGKIFTDKSGKTRIEKQRSTKLAEAKDAHTLSSGTPVEKLYADHSNRLKAMANEARKEVLATKPLPVSASAKVTYKKEVASLDAKLRLAQRNAPLERQAQIIANTTFKARLKANPDLSKDQIKKIKHQELVRARLLTGAKKQEIDLTDTEWQAIQSGAVNNTKMQEILRYSNPDKIRKLATPRKQILMSDSNLRRAQAMLKQGKTQAEVANALGVSLSTLKKGLKGE